MMRMILCSVAVITMNISSLAAHAETPIPTAAERAATNRAADAAKEIELRKRVVDGDARAMFELAELLPRPTRFSGSAGGR